MHVFVIQRDTVSIHVYKGMSVAYTHAAKERERERRRTDMLMMMRNVYRIRPISVLRFWIPRVLLKQNLNFKGWNSHVHSGSPGKFESSNLSNNISKGDWALYHGSKGLKRLG